MTTLSNLQGRALEYAIVAEINKQLPSSYVQLSQRALDSQIKDFDKYLLLSPAMQNNYQKCGQRIFAWLDTNFSISNHPISIDRLPDSASRQGDVTDIRIKVNSLEINLSVKHNHRALKHQRPASTAQHCGYGKKSTEDIIFRSNYKQILTSFIGYTKGISNFKDLNSGIVYQTLYIPICDLVANFINNYCTLQLNSSHLFNFLVGNTNFYKVMFYEQQRKVLIEEFSQIYPVASLRAQSQQNYVNLHFSNGWIISMRLHTASSKITNNPSLKFDTQPQSIIVPTQQFII